MLVQLQHVLIVQAPCIYIVMIAATVCRHHHKTFKWKCVIIFIFWLFYYIFCILLHVEKCISGDRTYLDILRIYCVNSDKYVSSVHGFSIMFYFVSYRLTGFGIIFCFILYRLYGYSCRVYWMQFRGEGRLWNMLSWMVYSRRRLFWFVLDSYIGYLLIYYS